MTEVTLAEQTVIANDRRELINRLLEFDPSDAFHCGGALDDTSYYDAIDRVILLLRGDIKDWTSPRPDNADDVREINYYHPTEGS